MDDKKWTKLIILSVSFTIVSFGILMFLLDPVLNYGSEKEVISYYEYSTLYSNPGIAKHYEYDAVMVGTSMIQNTDVDLCDELFDCDLVRLPYSGGTSYDMKSILDICFNSNNDIKTVYWELDQFQLLGSSTEHRYPVPQYLYNYDIHDDLSYVLNLDVFYHYGLNNVLGTLRNQESLAERRGITLTGTFSKEQTLSQYDRPSKNENIIKFEESYFKTKVDSNLTNIISLVQSHSNTKFVFFMPPFSILYWDKEIQNGTFDATIDATAYAICKLLEFENVEIYYYQDDEEIIFNLDNYKDYSHYGNWINDQITENISNGKGKLTLENYSMIFNDFKKMIKNYDFESLFD